MLHVTLYQSVAAVVVLILSPNAITMSFHLSETVTQQHLCYITQSVADPEILKRGAEDIPVVIYRKCTQVGLHSLCHVFCTGKRCLIEKKSQATARN